MTELELRSPAHLVSRRAPTYWTVRALIGWVGTAVIVAVLFAGGLPTGICVGVAAAIAALALAHLLVMPRWRYRVHRWEITDSAVYTQSGWFTQERRIAPIARVQTVDTHRGPLEQLFGLSNITVTTASAKGPITIRALDAHVAEDAVAWLTERADRAGDDAT